MQNEQWKDIEGYEGFYQISNFGRVRRLADVFPYKQHFLKAIPNRDGYLYVCLSIKSKHKVKTIHRLVAQSFIPNSDNKPCVNHIDGNKTNNIAENLEWCTYSENTTHAYKTRLINLSTDKFIESNRAKSKARRKCTEEQVKEIKKIHLETGWGSYRIAQIVKLNRAIVENIIRNRNYKEIKIA